jgi:hypothetical protein
MFAVIKKIIGRSCFIGKSRVDGNASFLGVPGYFSQNMEVQEY